MRHIIELVEERLQEAFTPETGHLTGMIRSHHVAAEALLQAHAAMREGLAACPLNVNGIVVGVYRRSGADAVNLGLPQDPTAGWVTVNHAGLVQLQKNGAEYRLSWRVGEASSISYLGHVPRQAADWHMAEEHRRVEKMFGAAVAGEPS